MNTQPIKINIPLSFNQIVDIVRQLSPSDKTKLKQLLHDGQQFEEHDISEAHKNTVRQRIRSSQDDPSRLLKWDEAKHQLKL